jgi:DNA-binding CsgD family transcriptional regulator
MTTSDLQISDREREILRLVATGATNQQIAQQLHISPNTVKVHLRNIFGKIGVASRTEATLYAVRTGLVQVGEAAVPPGAEASAPASEAPQAPPSTGPLEDAPPVTPTPVPAAAPRARLHPWLLGAAVVLLLVLAAIIYLVARPLATPGAPAATTLPGAGGVEIPKPDQRWLELPPMPAGRAGFALAGQVSGSQSALYVIAGTNGGSITGDVQRFDPGSRVWTALSAKPTAVTDVQAAVIGNRVYVPGGRLASGAITNVHEAYDPQRDRWVTLKPLPAPRSGYALAAVDGKLYLFGGWDGTTYRADVWQYNPDTDTWAQRTPMPTARAFAGAVAGEGLVYIFGGENSRGVLATNERYVPAEEGGAPWATRAPLPVPTSHMAAALTSGIAFLLSGGEAPGRLMVYNLALDSWQLGKAPLAALRDLRAQALGSKLYILGGQGAEGISPRAYEYQAMINIVLPLAP